MLFRSVFTCSLHGARNFPFRKEASDLDVDLPDGCRDDEYLHALDRALEELDFFSREVKILGVYPAHPFRIETQKAAE